VSEPTLGLLQVLQQEGQVESEFHRARQALGRLPTEDDLNAIEDIRVLRQTAMLMRNVLVFALAGAPE
jgi:hypothetical protein